MPVAYLKKIIPILINKAHSLNVHLYSKFSLIVKDENNNYVNLLSGRTIK